jgi:tetratricopeptide (TPR) repeat protein
MRDRICKLRTGLVLFGLLLLIPIAAEAQGGSISGSVILPNGAPLNERAKVILQTDRGVKSNVYTDNRGRFEFSRLTPNIYEVVIEPDGDRFEIARATVEVFPGAPAMVNVNLKEKKAKASPNGSRVISAGELDTSIPAAAKKEFERGAEASKAGNIEESIAHLRKAVELYPQYVMAHNDLGAQLLALARLDEAAEEFRRAIQLDSKAFNPRLNLGIVLVQKAEFTEAAALLKTALEFQPNSAAARLYYGLALAGINQASDAERELKMAHELGGATFAIALFHLGQLYFDRGELESARTSLRGYLREAPNGTSAAQARKLLDILK